MRMLLQALLALSTVAPSPPAEMIHGAADSADRLTLPATINGHGPYRFTVDTGADRSVVSDRLAGALGLGAAAPVTLYSVGGPETMGTVALDALRIGRRDRHVAQAPVLPEEALGAEGFIGLDALAEESVLFDFRHDRVTIAQSRADVLLGDPDTIVVTGKNRFGQLILTDAEVAGRKVYAIIDTGAQNTLGNLALRGLMGRSGPLNDKGARVTGVTGVSLPVEMDQLRHVRLGTMTLEQMPVGYADIATFRKFGIGDRPAILIGMDVLRTFARVAVDFRRREVRFQMEQGTAFPATG